MIFDFGNYRDYLKEYISQKPKRGFGESKKISTYLRVSSTFISHVLAGKKELSSEQTSLLSEYLGLTDLETEYFFYLVQFEKAGNESMRRFCKRKIKELKGASLKLSNRVKYKKDLSEEEKTIFYSSPLYSAVSLFCSLKDDGFSLEDIERRFILSRSKALKVLRFLVETGLCIEVQGKYKIGTQSTHIGSGSPHLLKHHTNWRVKAIQAADSLDETELMYTAQVSLSKEDFLKLREKMVKDINQFLETVYPSRAEEIACFNLDWFWIR